MLCDTGTKTPLTCENNNISKYEMFFVFNPLLCCVFFSYGCVDLWAAQEDKLAAFWLVGAGDEACCIQDMLEITDFFYVHECKWTERKPNIHQFKNEMRIYFDTLTGLTNRKAIRTVALYRALRSSLWFFIYPLTFFIYLFSTQSFWIL